MSGDRNFRVCRYDGCNHPTRDVDITGSDFVKVGNRYFHKDCYSLFKKGAQKDENTKNDFQFIKNLWVTHINNAVVYSDLFRILNMLVKNGVKSDYIAFTVQYCIEHKFHLNYPAGIKYYLSVKEIKDAYAKKIVAKAIREREKKTVDTNTENEKDDSPEFHYESKKSGFQSILGKTR